MSSPLRIATRHVFESRILIRFRRGNKNYAVQGWARDLSEGGLAAFVAEPLVLREGVTLEFPLADNRKTTIPAIVARQLGTQYGFQFTALSAEQRCAIQKAVKGKPVIPCLDTEA